MLSCARGVRARARRDHGVAELGMNCRVPYEVTESLDDFRYAPKTVFRVEDARSDKLLG